MQCWLLEDAVYDFYQNNCKGCKERLAVGLPNISEFVGPRESEAARRKQARDAEELSRKQEMAERRNERAEMRANLSLEETFVLDLIDELDQEGIEKNEPRLEQLANLAPETFTRKIVEHLLPAVLDMHLPYSIPAGKALLNADLDPHKKLAVAVRLLNSYVHSPNAIDAVLSDGDSLSRDALSKVLRRFVSMALAPPPGMHIGGRESLRLDSAPIHSLFKKRSSDISLIVDEFLGDAKPSKICAAVETILAVDDDKLLRNHVRNIFAKLMRRRTLLTEERRDSNVIYYLRIAGSKCLDRFPKETDKIIQAFLADNDEVGAKEAYRIYSSVLKHNYRKKAKIGAAQRIAFKRLLWAAVENPEKNMDDAGQFFRRSWDELAELAVENFDDLIGAAATLSEKYEQADLKPSLELTDDFLAEMNRRNKRTAIDSLQGALIEWAAIGAKTKGSVGINEFLELYGKLPQNQTQMRGNMIVHVSKLLTGVESLTLVLSDWYRALMDESTLVRASAAQAWENVPHDLVKNFPDLFFEAFAVLLSDPYVMVHRSAVQSLQRRSFPEDKRYLVSNGLWNLIISYSRGGERQDFVVDCIDSFAYLCLSPEERDGDVGMALSGFLLNLEGSALYHAVDRLHYGFRNVPGFVKVALKSIQSDYTRSISTDDCASAILEAPRTELRACSDEIKKAFDGLKPFRPEVFIEALLYATALTRAGDYSTASACFKDMLASVPSENRNEQWRLEVALISVAIEIEQAIGRGEEVSTLVEERNDLLSDLEKENAERAKHRNLPFSVFLED